MDQPPPGPEPYVAPRTGLRQARRAWLPAMLAAAAGAATPFAAFVLARCLPVTGRDDYAHYYLGALAFAFAGMVLFSMLRRRWWLPLFFVLGALPLGFIGLMVFSIRC